MTVLQWPAHVADAEQAQATAAHVRAHEAVWFIRYRVTGYSTQFCVGPYPREAADLHASDVAGYSGVHSVEVIDGLDEHEAVS